MRKKLFLVLTLGFLSLAATSTNSYFSDQSNVNGSGFTAGTWPIEPLPVSRVVINEVYYDVSPEKGGEGTAANPDEWIELYNGGNASVNLKDWTVADNLSTRTIHSANIDLAPGEYALIAKDNSTFSLYWSVPSGVEIIPLGQKIGNGLANTGDRLILRNAEGNIVDEISYGNDSTVLNPAISSVAEGHSIERNPDGLDNDSASDFIDQAVPTPGS